MSNLEYQCTCVRCGKAYVAKRKGSKYCSKQCNDETHKEKMRIQYVGKREKVCRQCGKELPKNKTRFCSNDCKTRFNHIKSGAISHTEVLEKNCIVCGKEFKTWKSQQKCCSQECSKTNQKQKSKPYDPEYYRQRYLRRHPGALTAEERLAERKKQAEQRKLLMAPEIEKRKAIQKEREKEWARKRAEKEARKKFWTEYEAEHECCFCGNSFIAHYPTAKYCSGTCARNSTRIKDRYKEITIDKGITLPKLAERDHNQCQICGLFVDWNDYIKTDKTIICGNMYPSIDHIRPISKGGKHAWDNVQLAHRHCNTVKSNKVI